MKLSLLFASRPNRRGKPELSGVIYATVWSGHGFAMRRDLEPKSASRSRQ
jgi:hypothetical protein